MIRRAVVHGLVGGFLLSLAGLYPAIALFAPLFLPNWVRPVPNELLHGLFLMASAVVGMPVLLGVGIYAASRTRAHSWREGAKAGVLAGLVAGAVCYLMLVSPLNALAAYGHLLPQPNTPFPTLPPLPAFVRYIALFEQGDLLLNGTLALFALLGGVQGAYWGWRKRQPTIDKPRTLYRVVIDKERHPRDWFRDKETAARAGLLVGCGVAVLIFITLTGQLYAGIAQGWPELAALIRQSNANLMIEMPERRLLPLLDPLLALLLPTFGALVVLLTPNPPDRFRARIRGTILAANIILLAFLGFGLRIFYFNVGLVPFWVLHQFSQDPAGVGMLLEQTERILANPAALIGTVLLTPWVLLLLLLLVGWLVGLLQGTLYTLLLSLFLKRPVDEAVRLERKLKQQPTELLPLLFGLFRQAANAYDILVHLCVRLYERETAVSHLLAAYHTLGSSGDGSDQAAAIATIHTTLTDHPDWHWGPDYAIFYHMLGELLAAQTLEQILAIQPPPTQQTSTLPPIITRSMERLVWVINELHKMKRVEDLTTQLIFLENGQEGIYEAQQFVKRELTIISTNLAATLPEQAALTAVLDHWQKALITAIRRLKGRAAITSTLQTQSCTYCHPLPLRWRISNQGLNVAQDVRLRLLPNAGYELTERSETTIAILPPGEDQMVQLTLLPPPQTQRLRVEWEIIYDDAVDDDRRMAFGDVVDFTVPDKPFERIFPIPYVTGTPLKSDSVFVGREDVFAFIRENLLGTYQNNVIILHGQRRTGKTSVLYRLGQAMAETHYGVLIDMQGKPARGEADFLYSIADDIVFALEDAGVAVDLPSREDFERNPEFYFAARFLRGLRPFLQNKNLLLMFDEFEELQRRVEDGRLRPEIFQFLRNLMQHETRVDFIFSGTHKLEDLGAEYWSVLFNIAAYKPITFLSPQEIRRLILEPVAEYPIEYDPLAIERIIEVTAGHPYFTQLVLHEMIVYYNEMQVSYLTIVDVDQVLGRIIERGEAHFKYIWAESSPAEREVLQGMAELLTNAEVVSVGDLVVFLQERGCKSKDRWQSALASLRGRDILTAPNAKSPLHRFKVDLIRRWIDATRPAL